MKRTRSLMFTAAFILIMSSCSSAGVVREPATGAVTVALGTTGTAQEVIKPATGGAQKSPGTTSLLTISSPADQLPGTGPPVADTETSRETQADTKKEYRAETKPAKKTVTKPETKPETGSGTQAATKPETRPLTKSDTKKEPGPETKPSTNAPETTAAETSPPETATPGTTAPETAAPDTAGPETTTPGTTAPLITAPETTTPGTTAPLITAPETTTPATTGADTSAREVRSNLPEKMIRELDRSRNGMLLVFETGNYPQIRAATSWNVEVWPSDHELFLVTKVKGSRVYLYDAELTADTHDTYPDDVIRDWVTTEDYEVIRIKYSDPETLVMNFIRVLEPGGATAFSPIVTSMRGHPAWEAIEYE